MLIEQTLEKLTAMKLGAMAEAVQQLGSDEATALRVIVRAKGAKNPADGSIRNIFGERPLLQLDECRLRLFCTPGDSIRPAAPAQVERQALHDVHRAF